jgi:hypothetical protein
MHDHQHQVHLLKHERMLINLLKRQRRIHHQLRMYEHILIVFLKSYKNECNRRNLHLQLEVLTHPRRRY